MRIFKEEQRFTQLWIIVLIVSSTIVPIGIYLNEYLKDPSKHSVGELMIFMSLMIAAPCFIFIFKLATRIDDIGIHYKFFPFYLKFKMIPWKDIHKIYIRTYDPIGEYGGWGLRGGFFWKKEKGKAINVSGDIGIQLELKDGKKLLIGTQKQSEVEAVLSYYKTQTIQTNDV